MTTHSVISAPGKIDTDAAIALDDARKSFGHRVIFDGIGLTGGPGEFVALLGASGLG